LVNSVAPLAAAIPAIGLPRVGAVEADYTRLQMKNDALLSINENKTYDELIELITKFIRNPPELQDRNTSRVYITDRIDQALNSRTRRLTGGKLTGRGKRRDEEKRKRLARLADVEYTDNWGLDEMYEQGIYSPEIAQEKLDFLLQKEPIEMKELDDQIKALNKERKSLSYFDIAGRRLNSSKIAQLKKNIIALEQDYDMWKKDLIREINRPITEMAEYQPEGAYFIEQVKPENKLFTRLRALETQKEQLPEAYNPVADDLEDLNMAKFMKEEERKRLILEEYLRLEKDNMRRLALRARLPKEVLQRHKEFEERPKLKAAKARMLQELKEIKKNAPRVLKPPPPRRRVKEPGEFKTEDDEPETEGGGRKRRRRR